MDRVLHLNRFYRWIPGPRIQHFQWLVPGPADELSWLWLVIYYDYVSNAMILTVIIITSAGDRSWGRHRSSRPDAPGLGTMVLALALRVQPVWVRCTYGWVQSPNSFSSWYNSVTVYISSKSSVSFLYSFKIEAQLGLRFLIRFPCPCHVTGGAKRALFGANDLAKAHGPQLGVSENRGS